MMDINEDGICFFCKKQGMVRETIVEDFGICWEIQNICWQCDVEHLNNSMNWAYFYRILLIITFISLVLVLLFL